VGHGGVKRGSRGSKGGQGRPPTKTKGEGLIVTAAPEVEGVVGLNLVLDVVGEVVEEIVAGDALDLIDRVGVLPDAALAVFVGEDEADGVVAVVLFGAYHLEEG